MTDGRAEIPEVVKLPFTQWGFHAEARALGRWNRLAGELALPPMELCDSASAEDGSAAELVILRETQIDLAHGADEGLSLAIVSAAVLARWDQIEAAAVPFRIVVPASAGVMWRGVLLPFAAADGSLGVVRLILWRMDRPQDADLAQMSAGLSIVGRTAPRPSIASPWERSDGAISLLAPAPVPALAPAERFAVARTWAALAQSDPGQARRVRLHAALAAAFDLLQVVHPAQIAEAVFSDSMLPADVRVLALALAHGERLGLDRTGFATLLDRLPGGYRELAASAESVSRQDMGGLAPADHVEIEPVDISWLRRRARRTASDSLWTSRYAA